MNLVFMGTPDFAVPTLKMLHNSRHSILAVVTQPDRPKGRGQEMQASPVKLYALEQGLKVYQPEKASAPEFVAELAELQPDLIVVIAYGQILRENLLSVPKHFCMNIHASLLPKYRGAAPINWAIINGDQETGVTTMKMDKGLDTGDILLMKKVTIENDDTAQHLHDKLSEAGGTLALETVEQLENGELKFIPQNDAESTYASKLKKEDGCLRWDQEAEVIRNRVRGMQPWPGTFGFLKGKRLRICKVETGPGTKEDAPGVVMRVSDYGIEIGTLKDRIIVTEIQPEGKKKMAVKSYLQGHPVEPGERFDVFGVSS
ncbi:MAG TPA: methionyl-tRNA formyltransferase [Desulfobacteria bacterium]|nr:methionyl-tRNA formyltransferase [Desulfobacteria bacterium]